MKMKDTIIVDQYYIQPLSDEISQVLNIKIDINDQNNILAYITLEPLNVLLRKRTISHIVDFFDLEIENSALKCTNLGVQYEENNLLNLINSTFKIKKLVMGKTFLNVSLENDQSVIQNSNFEILNKSVNFKDLKIVWNKLKMRDTTILEAFGRMKFQLEYILENDLADKFLKSISVVRPIRQILRAFTQLVVKPFDTSQERIKKKDREQIMRTQESHKLEIFAENLRCTFAKVALEGYSILESLKFG